VASVWRNAGVRDCIIAVCGHLPASCFFMEISLTAADSGQRVEVRPGDMLRVTLAENPTTGYCWVVNEGVPPSLKPLADFFNPEARSGVGGGGWREFRWRAVPAAGGELTLRLLRPWDSGGAPLETVVVGIFIGQADRPQ